MKILICSWANIFEPDIIYAFQKIGMEIDIFQPENCNPFNDTSYIKLLSNKLLSTQYAFVFSANYIPYVSMACNIHKVKYISWIADCPCSELNSQTISNSINYIFLFDKAMYQRYYQIAPNTLYYLPLASNVDRIDQIFLTHEEEKKYCSDITFIGSLYTGRSKYDNITFNDYWSGYFNALIDTQLKIYGYNFLEEVLTQEAIDAFITHSDIVNYISENEWDKLYNFNIKNLITDSYLGPECSKRERHSIVTELSKQFQFYLYSNDDTSSYPYVHNRGTIDPYIEAFKVYKATKINLNITSKTIKTGLPLRIFDVLSAGGFLITNYQQELPDFFEIGTDLVVYESIEDLTYKVDYYLTHEEERLQIAANGYNKVKEHYQFTNSILKMLQIVYDNQ